MNILIELISLEAEGKREFASILGCDRHVDINILKAALSSSLRESIAVVGFGNLLGEAGSSCQELKDGVIEGGGEELSSNGVFIEGKVGAVDDDSPNGVLLAFSEEFLHVSGSAFNDDFEAASFNLAAADLADGEELLGDLDDSAVDFADSEFLDAGVLFEDVGGNGEVAAADDDHVLVFAVLLQDETAHVDGVVVVLAEGLGRDLHGAVEDQDPAHGQGVVHADLLELTPLAVQQLYISENFGLVQEVVGEVGADTASLQQVG